MRRLLDEIDVVHVSGDPDIEVGNRRLRRDRRRGQDEHGINESVFVGADSCTTPDFEVGDRGLGWDRHPTPFRRLVPAEIGGTADEESFSPRRPLP